MADSRFIAGAVDVNITVMTVNVAAAIEAGLQSFQPENARGDGGVGHSLPCVTDDFAAFENGSDETAVADFLCDPMQAARGSIRPGFFANAEF